MIDRWRPYIGIVGVLIGALASTLGSRITTFGLSDLRGVLHAGYDEGAWITTAYGVGQIVIGVACPYLGTLFGTRRMLFVGIGLFFVASLLAPLSPNLDAFLAMQFAAGLGSGMFIPLTIKFIAVSLPPRLTVYGLAAYAVNLEFSLNVGAALEGWYAETWSIAWLNWQYCLMLPVMFACVWIGVPREPVNTDLLRDHDAPGLAYAAAGFGLIYAGLDQGNRLDWNGSGLVVGLIATGVVMLGLFAVRELAVSRRPFFDLHLLAHRNLMILMLLLAAFRFIILSTAYIIPTYLQVVQNFRELQVGPVLLFIALPQLVLVVPLGWLLARVDGRWVLAAGTLLIALACLQATMLTARWATWDFLPSQAFQAVGQSLALTALVGHVDRRADPGRPAARRRDRHGLHADPGAGARTGPFQPAGPACRSAGADHGRAPRPLPGCHQRRRHRCRHGRHPAAGRCRRASGGGAGLYRRFCRRRDRCRRLHSVRRLADAGTAAIGGRQPATRLRPARLAS
jgi:DHA2 family multidrug resistance protein